MDTRHLTSTAIMVLAAAIWCGDAAAEDQKTAATDALRSPLGFAALGPAGAANRDLAGSSLSIDQCYLAGSAQSLCFTVHNGSADGEWIDRVLLSFPTVDGSWTAACAPGLQDVFDSMGYTVNLACSVPQVNQVLYQDSDSDGFGEISAGASWFACVDLTVPAGYVGNRFIPWELQGDGTNTTSGSIEIEECTPLTLRPSEIVIEGCNGTPQALNFELSNYGAGNVSVGLSYSSPDGEFTGPTGFAMAQGNTVTFTTTFVPDLCLAPGQVASATLVADGGGHSDTSTVSHTITASAGWHRRGDSPVTTMDNAVVWASHRDGGLWSIGGFGAAGATQRFDPASGSWSTGQPESTIGTPIEYPMDGCYGLDGADPATAHEIVVLFPDTVTTGALHVYDITADSWSTRPIPAFFPPGFTGRWGFDVVSLRNNPSLRDGVTNPNLCYLSGGADQPGGGTTRDLWVYDPLTNSGAYLGNFASALWFGFHASWYVPWVGDAGAICVAGGVDHNFRITSASQCYDLATASFHAANVDLGPLPEPWWGMADGWRMGAHGHELWLANGVSQNGVRLPASAYLREGMAGFAYGPDLPDFLYRLEGDGLAEQLFTLGGAQGGFIHSAISLELARCPTCPAIFEDDFETGDTTAWSASLP